MSLLVVLDSLTPAQRVAVVLHDALDMPFSAVADVLACTEEAARQHASRGRRRLAGADLPDPNVPADTREVVGRLADALRSGDATRLAALLAPGVVLTGDGGGRVTAFRRPMVGATEVAKVLLALTSYLREGRVRMEVVDINGSAGLLMYFDGQRPQDPRIGAYAVTVSAGQVVFVHGVLAPDKVSHLPGSPYPRPLRGLLDRVGAAEHHIGRRPVG